MTPATSIEQAAFVSILPEIEGRLHTTLQAAPEEKEEQIALAVGHAFLLFLSATRRGKRVTPSTLAFYAKRMTHGGRPIGSSINQHDVYAVRPSRRPLPLEEGELAEFLTDGKHRWPIPDEIAFRHDRRQFINRQPRRDQKIAGLLAKGYRRSEAAEIVGISRPRVTQRMQRLREEWQGYQDEGSVS